MKVCINLGHRSDGSSWNSSSRILGHALRRALEALVEINYLYLQLHNVPPLYKAGVRYREEPRNTMEEFASIPVVAERRWGDCDDLAPWRVAELRKLGEKAKIRIQWKKNPVNGKRLYHVLVRRADGRIEDPSKLLGMR
jgi:hypothetical protein